MSSDENEDKIESEGYWKNDLKNGLGKQVVKNEKKDRIKIVENMWKDDVIVE